MIMEIHVNSLEKKEQVYQAIMPIEPNGSHKISIVKIAMTRTAQQNRALHKWLTMVGQKLNEAGWNCWALLLRKTVSRINVMRRDIKASTKSDDYKLGYLNAIIEIEQTLPKSEVDWNCELVKNHIWRPVQESQIGKESSADADRHEYTVVYENLNRYLGQSFGVHVPWPVEKNREGVQ
jgi:hypothetical protein